MARSRFRQPSILPGFGLTLGFTTFFLSVLVLLPLAALVLRGRLALAAPVHGCAARSDGPSRPIA